MHRMTILYGHPDDPVEFRRYYDEVHVPLARKMPGLIGWNLCWLDASTGSAGGSAGASTGSAGASAGASTGSAGASTGTAGGSADGWFLVAELYTEDRAAMTAMLESPQGRAASADLDNFVTGGVVFLTGDELQVPLTEEVAS